MYLFSYVQNFPAGEQEGGEPKNHSPVPILKVRPTQSYTLLKQIFVLGMALFMRHESWGNDNKNRTFSA